MTSLSRITASSTPAASATVSTMSGGSSSGLGRPVSAAPMRLLPPAQRVRPAQRDAAMQTFQLFAQPLRFGGQAGDIGLQLGVARLEIAVFPLRRLQAGRLAGHVCGTITMRPATTAARARQA